MNKSIMYNNELIKKQEKVINTTRYKYYNNKCKYNKLEQEDKKIFKMYRNLEQIINNELEINK